MRCGTVRCFNALWNGWQPEVDATSATSHLFKQIVLLLQYLPLIVLLRPAAVAVECKQAWRTSNAALDCTI